MIPPGFIQDVLTRTDIAEVIGRHVELKKAGVHLKGLCPFHGEKSPSFIVSPSRQTYHCFGCGVHGNAIGFLMEHLGLNFVEAVQDLAHSAGLTVPQEEVSQADKARFAQEREQKSGLAELMDRASAHYRKQLKASPTAIAYLKGRGLSGEIAQLFGLGYAPAGWRSLASAFPSYDEPNLVEAGLVIQSQDGDQDGKRYDRFRDRIMFPIRNVKGETIAFGGRVLDSSEPKYLNSPETPLFVKGQELYGLYEARSALRSKGYALVCEGYMDVVALAQLGFPNAVATLGTACTSEHVQKLLRFTEQVVFSFDGDAAGRRAAARAMQAALPFASDTRSFRFLFLPSEHDPDSFIRAEGQAAFEAAVRAAKPLSAQIIDLASQDCDLSVPEGRTRMLAQAREFWAALPEGLLRGQMLQELARLGGVSAQDLAQHWRDYRARHEGRGAELNDGDPGPDTHSASPNDSGFPSGRRREFNSRHSGKRFRPGNTGGQGGSFYQHAQSLPARQAPKRAEDRLVQMLFGQPAWWLNLSPDEVDALHQLPSLAHQAAVAWLERDVHEHGIRSWAVLKLALQEDASLPEEAIRLANADEEPDPGEDDFQRTLDAVVERHLAQRMKDALARAATDPNALEEYRQVDARWREIRLRQGAGSRRN